MLTEERLNKIQDIVKQKGSVTIFELMDEIGASESTIRRDLVTLDNRSKLTRVRGGAIAKQRSSAPGTRDDLVLLRKERNTSEKLQIAEYAASLINEDDFVFIDAGTTTEMMIPFIRNTRATFITNAISHAVKLSELDLPVYIIGGEFKQVTEAVVGEEALASILKYTFTKGFFGTNGITVRQGYTTPEIREARIKEVAMSRCLESYVLADDSKFSAVATVSFGAFDQATVLTNRIPPEFKGFPNVRLAQTGHMTF